MFDMLLGRGPGPSLLPSWGKGVAVTLHVLILGALWRAPASPAPAGPVIIDVLPSEPVTTPPRDPPLPPQPGPVCQCGWELPPVAPPTIPVGVLNTPSAPISAGSPIANNAIFGPSR